jgi:hypothetical protein
MVASEISLIRFGVLNFFHLVVTSQPFSPVTTKLVKLVDALISSEPENDAELSERVKWIKENTHEKIAMPISIIEYVVFSNLDRIKNFNREVDIKNKSFNLIFLYRVLDDISSELTSIVIKIAKKYSIDMPFITYENQQQKTTIEI